MADEYANKEMQGRGLARLIHLGGRSALVMYPYVLGSTAALSDEARGPPMGSSVDYYKLR